MTKPSKPPTRFGLETCLDMYQKLKWEARRLENGWSVYDTFNFVVTAHHLYIDWIDSCGSPEAKAKKLALPEPAKTVLQSIIDLANGNKHWQMTNEKSIERQVITKAHEPVRGDWYAYFVAGSMVYAEFGDYILSMRVLKDLLLGYFKWIFEDGDTVFPQELQNQLELCRIRPETLSPSPSPVNGRGGEV
jgi:hypothetical protein